MTRLLSIAVLVIAPLGIRAETRLKNLQIVGEAAIVKDELVVRSKAATFAFHETSFLNYRAAFDFVLGAKGGPISLQIFPDKVGDPTLGGMGKVVLVRDLTGRTLNATVPTFDGKWFLSKKTLPYHFWPVEKGNVEIDKLLKAAGVAPQTWHDKPLRLQIDVEPTLVSVYFEGLLVHAYPRHGEKMGTIGLQLSIGDRVLGAGIEAIPNRPPQYLPIDLSRLTNDRAGKIVEKTSMKVGQVPFELCTGEQNLLSLRQASWWEAKRDPASFTEKYDAGPAILRDPFMPLLRVPNADYSAMHVLAFADADPERTNRLTLQAGRYGFNGQVVQYDFFGTVPRPGDKAKGYETPLGTLHHVRVPIDVAFAQDLDDYLEMTLTKDIRLARRQPDPCRFRYRPLGVPSGVKIAAITLERSPVQMRVTSKESGHAFEEPNKPQFQVQLENISASPQTVALNALATHLDGSVVKASSEVKLEAGKKEEVTLTMPITQRGYFDLSVTMTDSKKQPLLQRRTSLALLPGDTRKHREQSPFGTWDFCGGHFTCDDPEALGPLYVKLGLRYGMFSFSTEARKKFGILPGNEVNLMRFGVDGYEKHVARQPDTLPFALLFHEDAISGPHVMRVPDLFTDFPRYKLSEAEKVRFKKMWDEASSQAKEMRAKFPKVHLRLGNGTLPLREEFLRNNFPHELFDSLGNETATFGRPPEAQPPDVVAMNASLWMDHQMLEAYGYQDKSVTQCYEICYPSCNPGNLTLGTQADYFVRHGIHALAWGIKQFRPGVISDVGNSYYYSNWGASGFCNKRPELSVKPAFVAFATMTRVLDGAKFQRVLDLGSPSLYGVEFELPNGERAVVLWTLRGKRPISLQVDGLAWRRIDDQAAETALTTKADRLEVIASASPLYIVGKGKIVSGSAGTPIYDDRPLHKAPIVSSLANLDDWTMEKDRNAELEFYNFLTPRRKGDFTFTPVVKFDGKEPALKVQPQPLKTGKATMPMYAVLSHNKGIELPGTPTALGLWINGNSGWGRVSYELTDAGGQRWINLGAQQKGDGNRWMEDWMPKELLAQMKVVNQNDWNTEDVFGVGRINFDGWRYVAFPLPGNYPGERYPWPANSQWRCDKDGVVRYPLTLRKVIFELPEKVLHMKTFASPRRGEIYVRDLTVEQGDVDRRKKVAWEER